MNNNNAPARVEPLYCPICLDDRPKTRRKASDIVCGDCYRIWADQAAINLAQGKYKNLLEWVAEKALVILPSLKPQLASIKTEIEKLQEESGKEAYMALKKSTGGKEVPLDIWRQAFRQKKQEVWRVKGGNAKFAKMKELESRIIFLKKIIEKAQNPEPQPAEEPVSSELEPEITPRIRIRPRPKNSRARKQKRVKKLQQKSPTRKELKVKQKVVGKPKKERLPKKLQKQLQRKVKY